MKVVTVLGARPQFIKAAPVSLALRAAGHREVLLHTGQHYDRAMSQVFVDELGLPEPDVNLGVGSGPHGWQTGEMLAGIEALLEAERPERVLVYGDTNSTLAGALAACKLQIPLAHIEAGLRSYNRAMPEEHNRVLTDHCADLLLCPSATAVQNLAREGLSRGVELVGDTMYDAALRFGSVARERSTVLRDLGLASRGYLLATLHRPANTDDPRRLREILQALASLAEPVVFPVHPRTRQRMATLGAAVEARGGLRPVDPLGYLDMLALEQNARLILTDSGGVQKEAYFFAVPCITLRAETEWVETVQSGWNVLAGMEDGSLGSGLAELVRSMRRPAACPPLFGDGRAAERIVRAIA